MHQLEVIKSVYTCTFGQELCADQYVGLDDRPYHITRIIPVNESYVVLVALEFYDLLPDEAVGLNKFKRVGRRVLSPYSVKVMATAIERLVQGVCQYTTKVRQNKYAY